MDLADYIGDYPFEMAKTGFEKQNLPMENGKENSYGFTFEKTQTIRLPPTSMRKVWRGNKWP